MFARRLLSARSLPTVSLAAVCLAAVSVPALAQQSGGLNLSPAVHGGPVGLARPLPVTPMPLITAQQMQNGVTGSDHQALNQNMIAALRGDPGYLGGFQFGTPLA